MNITVVFEKAVMIPVMALQKEKKEKKLFITNRSKHHGSPTNYLCGFSKELHNKRHADSPNNQQQQRVIAGNRVAC